LREHSIGFPVLLENTHRYFNLTTGLFHFSAYLFTTPQRKKQKKGSNNVHMVIEKSTQQGSSLLGII